MRVHSGVCWFTFLRQGLSVELKFVSWMKPTNQQTSVIFLFSRLSPHQAFQESSRHLYSIFLLVCQAHSWLSHFSAPSCGISAPISPAAPSGYLPFSWQQTEKGSFELPSVTISSGGPMGAAQLLSLPQDSGSLPGPESTPRRLRVHVEGPHPGLQVAPLPTEVDPGP